MIVLSRIPGEEIVVGDNYPLRVLSAHGGFIDKGAEDDGIKRFAAKINSGDNTVEQPGVEVMAEGWAGVM